MVPIQCDLASLACERRPNSEKHQMSDDGFRRNGAAGVRTQSALPRSLSLLPAKDTFRKWRNGSTIAVLSASASKYWKDLSDPTQRRHFLGFVSDECRQP